MRSGEQASRVTACLAISAYNSPCPRRVRPGHTGAAGADQAHTVTSSGASRARAVPAHRKLAIRAVRAVARPGPGDRAVRAGLACESASLVGRRREFPRQTGIARRVPPQHGRGRAQLAQAAVQVRRVGAGDAPGERVVLARRAQNAGPSGWAPPSRYARAIQPIPGQAGAVRALRAKRLQPAIAVGRALAGHARAVVHAPPAQIAETGGVRDRLHGRDRVGHARLHGALSGAEVIRWAFLTVVCLCPIC